MFTGMTILGTILAVVTFGIVIWLCVSTLVGAAVYSIAFASRGVFSSILAIIYFTLFVWGMIWCGSLYIHWIIGLCNDWATLAH